MPMETPRFGSNGCDISWYIRRSLVARRRLTIRITNERQRPSDLHRGWPTLGNLIAIAAWFPRIYFHDVKCARVICRIYFADLVPRFSSRVRQNTPARRVDRKERGEGEKNIRRWLVASTNTQQAGKENGGFLFTIVLLLIFSRAWLFIVDSKFLINETGWTLTMISLSTSLFKGGRKGAWILFWLQLTGQSRSKRDNRQRSPIRSTKVHRFPPASWLSSP